MTLRKKILIGYGASLAMMSLVFAWAVVNLVFLGRASEAILRENYRSILAAENMVEALERQNSGLLLLFLGDRGRGLSQFKENEAVFLNWLARAKENITVPGEAEVIHSIETDYSALRLLFPKWTDQASAKKPSPSIHSKSYQYAVYPLFEDLLKNCVKLRDLNEKTMYSASNRAGSIARQAIWSTVGLSALVLFIALVFSFFISEKMVRPIRFFMEASRKIALGDYTVRVPVKTGDELGLLAGEFNQMTSQLKRYQEMNIEQIISEKKTGEAILSSIEDGLVVFDTDLKVTAINPAARRMLNLESTRAPGRTCSEIIPVPDFCEVIKKTVEAGFYPEGPDENRIISLNHGEESRHYLFSINTIQGKEGGLSGIILVFKDVTRLKEVERLKSEFIMAASHELRTPLTSLGMSIDLLLEHSGEGLAPKDRELLQVAHEEIQRMKALVNDLLDLSRIESGKIPLEFDNVSVQDLFEPMQTIFKEQLENKSVALTIQLPEESLEICVDANKITWVLTNLISNALRYVQEGGTIHLQAERFGAQVRLSVRDDGPGIPPEYQAKIFQKFVQVKGRSAGGTGLGLAVCKEIVRAHGGTIWVESLPGQGSTFIFELPLKTDS